MEILIAEDDLTSSHILQGVLGKFGYEVTSAKDGEEAWKSLQQPDAPRLVVLDRMMPGRTIISPSHTTTRNCLPGSARGNAF